MDIRKVKKLIEMLEESQLNEIEIKEGEESVKLVKAITVPVQEQIVTSNIAATAPQPVAMNEVPPSNQILKNQQMLKQYLEKPLIHRWLEPFTQLQIQELKILYQLETKFQREMFYVSLKR